MAFRLSPQGLDRELVLEFFWRFSVFECALKREGFLRSGRNNVAEADWERFGRDIHGQFASVSLHGFREAVDALKGFSPRRQVVRNGELGWDSLVERPDASEETLTLRLLRTVRNNLFHGGKYPDGPIQGVARNGAILGAALTILDGCYAIHAGVKRRVDEAA